MPGPGEKRRRAMAEDRVKMMCEKCGYKCFPQWLNDKAHCLKCQTVLRTRGYAGAPREAFVVGPTTVDDGRRAPGEVSTYKQSPGSAMESTGGRCGKAPDGVHHWKYEKCNYCQLAEGKLAKGPGVTANPGGAAECAQGGKCMFKFAKCTKCGRAELSALSARAELSAAEPQLVEATELPGGLELPDGLETAAAERVKMECQVCGYSSVPQWLNDQAHCLKCNAVLRVREDLHGQLPEAPATTASVRRKPGEVSTYKHSSGSAMESAGGTCAKAPDGQHHWKYGKCNFCQIPEGKLVKGAGALANPGGKGGCQEGGKCMFKFSKCTKCGRKEF